jgi:hypothetical protein
MSRMDLRRSALPLHSAVCLVLGEVEIALQDAFGLVDDLARLQPVGQLGVLRLQARALNLGAHQNSDSSHKTHLKLGMHVGLAVLHVKHADDTVGAQTTGTHSMAPKRSSGRLTKAAKRGSSLARSGMATGSRCSATQPVTPCPTAISRRSTSSAWGLREARRISLFPICIESRRWMTCTSVMKSTTSAPLSTIARTPLRLELSLRSRILAKSV